MASLSDDSNNAELYKALMTKNKSKVLSLYTKFPGGAFHRLTIHGDTVLHMALHSGQSELVLELLQQLPKEDLGKIMSTKSKAGNTLLHEAATSDDLVAAAKKILNLNPGSLFDQNKKSGERALFRAVRYGQLRMFKFLDSQAIMNVQNEGDRTFLFYQSKEFTILHQAIINGHYELALWIAKKHGYLINIKDAYGMTGLQHLARNPLAFKHKVSQCFKPRVYSGNKNEECAIVLDEVLPSEDGINLQEGLPNEDGINLQEGLPNEDGINLQEAEPCCYLPKWEAMKKRKKEYESALELAKLLIVQDLSWKITETIEVHILGDQTHTDVEVQESGDATNSTDQYDEEVQEPGDPTIPSFISFKERKKNIEESLTPLFLAIKYGNVEIVKEIIREYPQAVEHIDKDGSTILHMAIKYGQTEVFDLVVKEMEVPMRRLVKKVDKQSNSILHMVGEKKAILPNEDKIESPAILLQRNLLLYERVKKICSAHFYNHLNIKGQTAEQVFAENNKELHNQAQDWLKNTAQNCTIVAVLIATVAFAAVYTVPGGSKPDTGTPVLLNKTFFAIFTIADVLSLTFTLTSVILFMSILTSHFQLKDFKNSLPRKLMLGVTFLFFSVSMMMLAFAATIILMIHNKEEWKKIALYSVALLPVGVFAISYMPLYFSLRNTLEYNLGKIWGVVPFIPKCRFIGNRLKVI